MKKTYSAPATEVHSMIISSLLQTASGIQDKGVGKLGQGLSNANNELNDSDPTEGNLAKGGSIWDTWE